MASGVVASARRAPPHPGARRLRGRGDRLGSLSVFRAVEAEHGCARAVLSLGEVADVRGDVDEARRHIADAAERFPALAVARWAGRAERFAANLRI